MLLAGRVPEVQDDDLVLDVHLVRHEVNSNSRLVVVIERVIDEPVNNGCFPDGLVPKKDYLVLELGVAAIFESQVLSHYSI